MLDVSFIIPAYNEADLLGETLVSIDEAARALPISFEVIVVDDASTDATRGIADRHSARVVAVNYRQISATRNAGAREACGDCFVFVDGDTTVTAELVESALVALSNGAVGGGCQLRFDGRVPLYGRALVAVALPLYRAFGLAAGCFLFCKREAFNAVGGFDETLFAAEEVILSRALRRLGPFVILDSCVVTSGRKLRSHSAREIFRTLLGVVVSRFGAVRRRDSLELWYGERRKDPG
jgi:glycosyltransferase involved in cell wall biosynthesis